MRASALVACALLAAPALAVPVVKYTAHNYRSEPPRARNAPGMMRRAAATTPSVAPTSAPAGSGALGWDAVWPTIEGMWDNGMFGRREELEILRRAAATTPPAASANTDTAATGSGADSALAEEFLEDFGGWVKNIVQSGSTTLASLRRELAIDELD